MSQAARGAVEDLPPSSKLVYKTLEWHGRLTQQAIIEKSLLSGRTVRDALSRLKERDVVEEGVYYRDARQNVYTLDPPDDDQSGDETTVGDPPTEDMTAGD